jgi:histidyl-tRNA synthetase
MIRQRLIDILAAQSPDELNLKLKIQNLKLTEGLSEELNYIFTHSKSKNLKFDLKLLRGLDYYTGTVLEMVSTEMEYGSIGGGGRYDDLTELFGLKDMSGIGISFGLDRVYDVMTELNRFPENSEGKKTLILNLTEAATSQYFSLLSEIRSAGKAVDLYPAIAKMDKQLTYADKAGYSYAIIIGENELNANQITVKDLKQRQQTTIDRNQLLDAL